MSEQDTIVNEEATTTTTDQQPIPEEVDMTTDQQQQEPLNLEEYEDTFGIDAKEVDFFDHFGNIIKMPAVPFCFSAAVACGLWGLITSILSAVLPMSEASRDDFRANFEPGVMEAFWSCINTGWKWLYESVFGLLFVVFTVAISWWTVMPVSFLKGKWAKRQERLLAEASEEPELSLEERQCIAIEAIAESTKSSMKFREEDLAILLERIISVTTPPTPVPVEDMEEVDVETAAMIEENAKEEIPEATDAPAADALELSSETKEALAVCKLEYYEAMKRHELWAIAKELGYDGVWKTCKHQELVEFCMSNE